MERGCAAARRCLTCGRRSYHSDPPTVEQIRDHFPALERTHSGRRVAYFDGPGGTQVPRQVADAIREYLFHHNANTHWRYPTSHETDAAILNARQAVAEFLNAHPDEVVFGANMTTLTFHLGRALGRGWGPGDEIVVTELEHHANIDSWRALARDRGVVVKMAAVVPGTGELDWEDLRRQITRRTRLLAIGAASNAIGTVNDVAQRTVLYRVLFHYFDRFLAEYEGRFEKENGLFRPIIKGTDLVRKDLLSPAWADRLLSWGHTGFSVHSRVRAALGQIH